MPTYPAYPQAYDSQRIPLDGIKKDRGGNNSLWIRRTANAVKFDFVLVHPAMTLSEYNALVGFYNSYIGTAVDLVWKGDGTTYTGVYLTSYPKIEQQVSLKTYRVSITLSMP